MARTINKITDAQSITVATTTGNFQAAQTDLNGNSSLEIALELWVANGTTGPTRGKLAILNYVFSNVSLGDNTTAPLVFDSAVRVPLSVTDTASVTKTVNTGSVQVTGRYLYTWVSVPDPLEQNVSVTVAYISTNPVA